MNTEEDRVISKAQQVHYLAGMAQLESILQALLNEFDDDLYRDIMAIVREIRQAVPVSNEAKSIERLNRKAMSQHQSERLAARRERLHRLRDEVIFNHPEWQRGRQLIEEKLKEIENPILGIFARHILDTADIEYRRHIQDEEQRIDDSARGLLDDLNI